MPGIIFSLIIYVSIALLVVNNASYVFTDDAETFKKQITFEIPTEYD